MQHGIALIALIAAALALLDPGARASAVNASSSFRGHAHPVIRSNPRRSYPFMYVGTAASVSQDPQPVLASQAVMGDAGAVPPAAPGAVAEGEAPPTLDEGSVMWDSDSVADQLRQAAESHADAALAIRQAAAALKETANSLRQGAFEVTHAGEQEDQLKAAIRDHIQGAEGEMGNLERSLVPQDQLQAAVAVALAPAPPAAPPPLAAAEPLAGAPPLEAPPTPVVAAPAAPPPVSPAGPPLPVAPAAPPPMAPAGQPLFMAPGSSSFPPAMVFPPTMFPPPMAVFPPPMPALSPAPAAFPGAAASPAF